jgi:hypothetical protein
MVMAKQSRTVYLKTVKIVIGGKIYQVKIDKLTTSQEGAVDASKTLKKLGFDVPVELCAKDFYQGSVEVDGYLLTQTKDSIKEVLDYLSKLLRNRIDVPPTGNPLVKPIPVRKL